MNVCHMTDAHAPFDDRIYLKECISLHEAGYDTYIVARGEDCVKEGVHIVGCGNPKGRIDRILFYSKRVYKKAIFLDCDIYHFHDPELLLHALRLKRRGKKVIFDSHEDVPAQILDKEWIPLFLRKLVASCYRLYETYIVKQIDAVVAATPHIGKQFEGRAKKIVIVNNYPRLDDITFHTTPFQERDPIICYAGGISEIRGEQIMIEAMKDLDAILILAGEHEKMDSGRVKYLGYIDRNGINRLYGQAVAGLILLLPTSNYVNSLPIKMFEYMAAGLPVIASDFPLWKKIIEDNHCGICVNPENVDEVRAACKTLLEKISLGEEMGYSGRKAVIQKYNWDYEKRKLLALYEELVNEEKVRNGM